MSPAVELCAPGDGLPSGFTELPHRLYDGVDQWVPEDAQGLEKTFSASNPWLAQGEWACLSVEGSARLVAFHQPGLRVEGASVAFFGYWETEEQEGVDRAIFERAEAWARERGATELYGPINFTTYGNYRLRLAAEAGARTFPDEPYNPSTYPQLLEALGFELSQTYLTQIGEEEPAKVLRRFKAPIRRRLLETGYRFEALGHERWLASLPELHGIIDAIFGNNFAYSPLSFEAFAAKCGEGFIRRACPHASVLALGPEGDIAGFFLVYPHYGPLVTQGAGEGRVLAAALDYETHASTLRSHSWRGAVAKTVGVSPAHRRKGVMEALTVELFERGEDLYNQWFGAMIRADNPSRRYADGSTSGERWYGLYRKTL